ncbi:MAG TPA: hypothetical protein VKB56_00985 [Terriglobales bacterium]|nr:hypothetical protein [Terriglobales bacterium]
MLVFLLAPEGFVGVLLVLVLIVVVAVSIRELTRGGRKGKYHAAIGNALMQVEPIFRPSREHIIEARQYEEVEDDEDSDPPTTGGRH